MQLTRGTAASHDASFSPNGTRLLFVTDSASAQQLYTMGIDGSDVRQLTSGTQVIRYLAPTYSPDGMRIAFSGPNMPSVLMTINAGDGSDLRQVYMPPGGGFVGAPAFSPDGQTILLPFAPNGHGPPLSKYSYLYRVDAQTGAADIWLPRVSSASWSRQGESKKRPSSLEGRGLGVRSPLHLCLAQHLAMKKETGAGDGGDD